MIRMIDWIMHISVTSCDFEVHVQIFFSWKYAQVPYHILPQCSRTILFKYNIKIFITQFYEWGLCALVCALNYKTYQINATINMWCVHIIISFNKLFSQIHQDCCICVNYLHNFPDPMSNTIMVQSIVMLNPLWTHTHYHYIIHSVLTFPWIDDYCTKSRTSVNNICILLSPSSKITEMHSIMQMC